VNSDFKKGFVTGASITAGVVVVLFVVGFIQKAV
jgi:hypothetical protein